MKSSSSICSLPTRRNRCASRITPCDSSNAGITYTATSTSESSRHAQTGSSALIATRWCHQRWPARSAPFSKPATMRHTSATQLSRICTCWAIGLEEELVAHFPVVFHAHNYYGTCLTGTKRFAFPSPRQCRRRFGVACLVLHYPRRCGGLHFATMARSYSTQRQRRLRLPRYGGVIVASSHMASEYAHHGVASSRLHRLPYPVPLQRDVEPLSPRTPSPTNVLFMSRLTDLKGGTHLIRAMRYASDALRRQLTLHVA